MSNLGNDSHALVLVVDRDPHVRELEQFFLTEAGFEVQFADHGIHAWELAQRLRPTVVLTEILVARLDGLTLCKRIKSGGPTSHASVIVMSFLAAKERSLDAGADAFLLKPLSDKTLIETVRRVITTRDGKDLR